MNHYNIRKINFGKHSVNMRENIIAPYQKISDNELKNIKHPSQVFMDKIKTLTKKTIFNSVEKYILKLFKKNLEEIISVSNNFYKKNVYIVLPPSKKGKKNQIITLINLLHISGDFEIIELISEDYSLKKMNKQERVKYLLESHHNWKISVNTIVAKDHSKSFFIFIDDLVTNGTTSFFSMNSIRHLYDLDNKPSYRSLYLMGTKSSIGYEENKVFEKPNIWNK